MDGVVCKACNRGTMVQARVHRLPGFIAVLGIVLMVVSGAGVGIGGFMLLGGMMMAQQKSRTPDEIRQDLQAASIPEPVIAKVLGETDESVSPEELKSLSTPQVQAVQMAQMAVVTKDISPELLVGVPIVVMAVSLIGLVVGWVLRMKKAVLQCAACSAVAPAS